MKPYWYSFLSIVLVTTFAASCSDPQPEHGHRDRSAIFPTLEYNIDAILKWDTLKYKNLVFQFYSASIEGDSAWQLICYGLKSPQADTVFNSGVYDKLPISTTQDSVHYVRDSVIVGNNIVSLKLLQAFAKGASDSGAVNLAFIPYDTSGIYKNYILYHIKVLSPVIRPNGTRFLRIDTLRLAPELRRFIKEDPNDNSNYLELNPCPPANMELSGFNQSRKYELFKANTRLVRSMALAHSGSHTTSTTQSTVGKQAGTCIYSNGACHQYSS